MLSASGPIQKAGGGGGGAGGVLSASGPIQKAGGGGGGGGGGEVLSSALGPIQKVKAGKGGAGGGEFSRKGGGTLYERGGCNPQNPPPPGSASALGFSAYTCTSSTACGNILRI